MTNESESLIREMSELIAMAIGKLEAKGATPAEVANAKANLRDFEFVLRQLGEVMDKYDVAFDE